jgi:hypothetical protein
MLKGKCRQAARLLSEGQDRPLSLGEQLPLGLHLLACPACRAFQQQLRLLRQASRRAGGKDDQSSP